MDYEKAYKEALERAKGVIEQNPLMEYLKKGIEYIFPELKESEDERIRKGIIRNLEYLADRAEGFVKDELEERIAWLEKQAEHANFRNKIQIGDKVTRNEDGVLVNLSQLNRVAKKQGEQKPAEFDDTNAKRMFIKALERVEEQNNKGYKLTDCDKNSWWEDFKAYTSCIVEQKPWSEEDERLRTSCIKHIEEELERIRNDKYGHSEIISVLKESCRERINWLKSIKDKYTWKPSDEQMDVLLSEVNAWTKGCYKQIVLESLYNNLKKLK